ncbi:MAG: hypothetical protein MR995_03555 [Fusobacterium mortiferum]|jgi:hypothetical protein|uniref:ATP-grasp fold amidoligase family protein n=1 Tax=Fusobacterium mortiferum TaxID=850 RepID=UPI003F926615|nr:hypothetical protein [Fusobacterium mortiferum]
MDYKKIFKKAETRYKILELLKFIPDEKMLKLQYKIKLKRNLNLKRPERFTEKLQWYKLNYRQQLLKKCVDKYEVRNFIISKGYNNILTKCYGVFEKVEDIDFDKLPNQFVIKKTNGGGGLNIIICKDKNNMNIFEIKQQINDWMKFGDIGKNGREWAYYDIKNRIIIEEYLENEINPEAGINDYKIFCFNGKAKYLVVDTDRYIGHKRNFYTADWQYLDVSSDCPNLGDTMEKPLYLDKLIEVAEDLSKDFPFVRVDLYLIKDKIYFGELTFYPWSGYVQFNPDSFDYLLGKEFTLNKGENCK